MSKAKPCRFKINIAETMAVLNNETRDAVASKNSPSTHL